MNMTTYEGVVEKGAIRLRSNVQLPENMKVYVIVPDLKNDDKQTEHEKITRMMSPRLVHRWQAADFRMNVSEE